MLSLPLRIIKLLGLLIPALYLNGCDNSLGEDYFPLQKGLSWTYTITTAYPDSVESEKLTIHSLGKHTVDDKSYYVRRSSYGIDYYLNVDDQGVYREALRTLVELKPRPDNKKRFVLKYPLKEGTNWRHVTRPMILTRVFPNKKLANSAQIPITYQITSTSDSVTVPAGQFENCIKIVGEGITEIYTDGVNGYSEIPFRIEEWYAPAVGLVKQVRHELDGDSIDVSGTPVFIGGSKTLELIAYD